MTDLSIVTTYFVGNDQATVEASITDSETKQVIRKATYSLKQTYGGWWGMWLEDGAGTQLIGSQPSIAACELEAAERIDG